VETVVRRGARPTLITTQYYYQSHKPLLATDGSPAALAALQTAVTFVRAFDWPLHVVHCAAPGAAAQACLDEARAHLDREAVAYTFDLYPGNAHDDLVQYMLDRGYDMLFMGAFGRRRLAEWVLGSTTQYLLRTCPGPLLLCPASAGDPAA
jgi:nucleotide-binding universal stress UspA family protein